MVANKENRVFPILMALAVLVLVVGIFFWNKKAALNPRSTEYDNGSLQIAPEGVNEPEETKNSKYVSYNEGILEENSGKRRILFFFANWCSTCKPADAHIKANENLIPGDVVVVRVNYNDSETDNQEKALARKYNVTYQHTFVEIDSEGNEVQKWNGGNTQLLLEQLQK